MPNFGSYVQRYYKWTDWKSLHASKYLIHQYEDNAGVYTVWGYDGPEVIVCEIYKGTVPDGILSSGYSQAQNDADKSDFEASYKNNANKPLTAQRASFSVVANDVATANNKSMFSLFNGAGGSSYLKIHEIWIQNAQNSNVSGVVTNLELRRITGHSGGSNLTIGKHDTNDNPDSNIGAKTNASVSGESAVLLDRWVISNDEWAPGTLDLEGFSTFLGVHWPVWRVEGMVKPIILRDGQGIHIKCATNTSVGSFDITVVFTQENTV